MLHETVRSHLVAILEKYLASASACHKSDHTRRVVATALRLADYYPDVDVDALEAAAWLHDIGRGIEKRSGVSHADISAELALDILPGCGFDTARIELICEAIADHRYSSKRQPRSLEGRLLQDADRLDALGAIGIARTFSESADRHLFHHQTPFGGERPYDDDRYALDHFYLKLLKLPETMHTPYARELAAKRVEFLCAYLRELASELGIANARVEN